MTIWKHIQNAPAYLRWPLKWLIVGITVFLVAFPDPRLFARHVQHWRDPNAMIDPDLPALQPLVDEVRSRLTEDMQPPQALRTVEQFVYEKIEYAWDWDNWGAADYLPTLAEALDKMQEDCDGRAVVAASIFQKLGYKAEMVTDFAHVWVKTDRGETMGARSNKSVEATDQGLKINWATFTNIPKFWAYGLSVFPPLRELIVVMVVWAMFLHGRLGWAFVVCLILLLGGLWFLRIGGKNPDRPMWWIQSAGYAHLIIAVIGATCLSRRSRTRNLTPNVSA